MWQGASGKGGKEGGRGGRDGGMEGRREGGRGGGKSVILSQPFFPVREKALGSTLSQVLRAILVVLTTLLVLFKVSLSLPIYMYIHTYTYVSMCVYIHTYIYKMWNGTSTASCFPLCTSKTSWRQPCVFPHCPCLPLKHDATTPGPIHALFAPSRRPNSPPGEKT